MNGRLTWLRCLLLLFLLKAPTALGQERPPRFEAGPVFSFLHQTNAETPNQFELGGRFSYNLFSHVGLEAEYIVSPFRPLAAGFTEGGRVNQASFGAKAGWRRQKWGVYARIRPGFIAYSSVIKGVSPNLPLALRTGSLMEPTFDVGGVVEFYLSRRILLRYDAGDTIILYGGQTLTTQPRLAIAGFTRNAFQFSTGFSFRF